MAGRHIHIRNWDHFQHRDTTRNQKSGAPWIKDYVGQLHDGDWLELTCAQRGLLQGLRLMYAASRGRGVSEHAATRLLSASSEEKRRFGRNLEALNHAGFIEFVDSKSRAGLTASRQQVASLEEKRVDVEGDTEEKKTIRAVPDPWDVGNGPGSENLKNQEGHRDLHRRRRIRPAQEDANGSHPAPSEGDGPLGDAVRDELARIQAGAETAR